MQGLFWRKNKPGFEAAEFKDSRRDRCNPGRGWYRVFTMDAAKPCPTEEWRWEKCGGEQLALLMIDIGSFASSPLSPKAVENIKTALDFFGRQGKEVILRVVYDSQGKGMENEPPWISNISGHIAQLSPVLSEYKDIIFCMQGMFIGSWGEMHSSKFLTTNALRAIWKSLRESAPEAMRFAVRKPEQYISLAGGTYDSVTKEKARNLRLGLFNDGLLGSETDLGTFAEGELLQALGFQDKLCRYVPNGGEAIGGFSEYEDVSRAAEHFEKIHITYLNSVYDGRILSKWKNQSFDGMNGYDYIGMRLGYRFLVTGAGLSGKDGASIAVQIKNTGFANIYDECEVKLLIADVGDSEYEVGQAYDLRELAPGSCAELIFAVPRMADGGSRHDMFLKICRKKDGRRIILANEGAADLLLLGKLTF